MTCTARPGQPAVYRCPLDTIGAAEAALLDGATRLSFVHIGFSLGAVPLELAET